MLETKNEKLLQEIKGNRLFSYTIPIDDGAAPNPFGGTCTLVICKPVIRRNAVEGDWIVGLGSKNSPIGNISHKIVYVMQVTKKITIVKYDEHCREFIPNKIPDIYNKDRKRHVGDCIYDFSMSNEGRLRPSVHTYKNKKTDMGGIYALLSDHFYYFGNAPIDLPQAFSSMIKSNQGHKSTSNEKIKEKFLRWFLSKGYKVNYLYGKPQIKIDFIKDPDCQSYCSEIHKSEDEKDEALEVTK